MFKSKIKVSLLSLFCPALLIGCDRGIERSADAITLPLTAIDRADESAATHNWPGWRGVNTSGISAEKDLPTQWSINRGVKWKANVPGRGNSSPVVWGDQVLLTSALGEDENSALVVCSFDRHSGQPRWQADAGKARGSKHVKNGFASASVTTDGRLVFASFGMGGLWAFDLETGQPKWHQDLGLHEHEWGMASSPVLVGNLVIQLCDSASNSDIEAFDKTTGEPAWHTARTSSGSWSTPVLVEATDGEGKTGSELVVNGTGTSGSTNGDVAAYDPADGHEIWHARGTTDVVCPTAIIGGGLVISTSGRNGPIIAIRPGGQGDVTATNVVWKHSHGGPYVPTGIAYRNGLYIVADGGVISCLNLGDGAEIWQQRLKGTFTASLVAGAGKVYAVNEFGVVYVLAAGNAFQLLATNYMEERCLATPAIVDGELFLRTETQLYCVSAPAEHISSP